MRRNDQSERIPIIGQGNKARAPGDPIAFRENVEEPEKRKK
jgi:hypothetical protein